MSQPLAAAIGAAALSLMLWAGAAQSHEGHDHDQDVKGAPANAAPRATAGSNAFELVAVARNGTLTLYLDRAETNEPVADAAVQAETPDGLRIAVPLSDGSYQLDAEWSEEPGRHDVVVGVSLDGVSETFPLTLIIPERSMASPGPAASAWATSLAVAHDFRQHLSQRDPLPLMLAGGGFLLGTLLTLLVRQRRFAPALGVLVLAAALLFGSSAFAHEGHDHGTESQTPMAASVANDLAQRQADGAVFVPKPTQRILTIRTLVTESATLNRTTELPGRVIPDPNASGVVQSSVGGRLSPPISGRFPRLGTRVKKGEVLAFVTPPVQAVDASDMRQRQGELDQQIVIVERRVDRFRKLSVTGAVAQTQLDDAQAELTGLRDRRAALDNIRREPEPLIAPVTGIIAEAIAVAGQMASPGTMVFHIVDPASLWVEALSFDALASARDATARLADGRTLTLAYQGAGLADRNQAVPVHFAIQGSSPELRTGQFVTVLASTDERKTGVALPRGSVVRAANGGNLVYEHTQPERFEPREVLVEPLDAERVLVVSGIEPGKRVVTQGAELLNQVR